MASKLSKEEIVQKYKLTELSELLCIIEGDMQKAIEEGKIRFEENYLNLLLNSLGKCIVTLREVMSLCSDGFPDGAMALARNMFEQSIIVAFFESKIGKSDFDECVRRYWLDFVVDSKKKLKFIAEKTGKVDEATRIKSELLQIGKREQCDIWTDYWWSGIPRKKQGIFSLTNEVLDSMPENVAPLINKMHISYKRACLAVHAGSLGNFLRVGDDTISLGIIDCGPWDNGQQCALDLATTSMLQVVVSTYCSLGMSPEKVVNELNDLALYYAKM